MSPSHLIHIATAAQPPNVYVVRGWGRARTVEVRAAPGVRRQVADMIADVHESGTPVMMTVVNAAEIWTIVARETSEDEADRTILELAQLGIQFSDADWKLAREAAR